jgi:hypothetical protein
VSVAPAQKAAFEKTVAAASLIGTVETDGKLSLGQEEISLDDIVTAWKRGF